MRVPTTARPPPQGEARRAPQWEGSQRPPAGSTPRSEGTRSEMDRWPVLRGLGGCRTTSERSLIRSDRPPEDRRPIEGLTSKPRPNSEPALFLFFFECRWTQGLDTNGEVYLFALSASTSNGDDEAYFFPLVPARDPWHTARLNLPAACDCRPADDMLLATEGAYQRISGTRGAPAVPHCEITVGSQRTGCSKPLTLTALAPQLSQRIGCSCPLCLGSLLTKKPKLLTRVPKLVQESPNL